MLWQQLMYRVLHLTLAALGIGPGDEVLGSLDFV